MSSVNVVIRDAGENIIESFDDEIVVSERLSDVYFDRNQLVKCFARQMLAKGYTVGYQADRENKNFVIVFIDLPTGQVSWHIPRSEIDLSKWPLYSGVWDLHSTDEKRVRLAKYLLEIST